MFYNLLEFPEGQPAFNRELLLREIINTYEPDIFMVCELQSQEGADEILEVSLNDTQVVYTAPPFEANQSGGANLQQLVFYRNDKFELLETDIIHTTVRDINRYVLQLNTVNGDVDPVVLDLYVSHLKSSQGGQNETLRLEMVTAFTDTLGDLDPNSFILFAGDLNLYTSTEPAYIELLDPTNPIVFVDPIDTPGAWNNNENFTDIHTQSTRTSSGPFGTGAGGGLDDRFDFILMSENMLSDPKLRYVTETYEAYGNNGNCFNMSINDETCTGEFGPSLRSNLYNMSDHLPVVMELETSEEIVILNGTEFEAELPLEITNTWVRSNLRLKIRSNEVRDLQIYDMLGKKLMQIPIESLGEQSLDVSHFPSGVYFLTTSYNNFYPIKFIKGN